MKPSALGFNLAQLMLAAIAGPILGSTLQFSVHEENAVSKIIVLSVVCAAAVSAICALLYVFSPPEPRWVKPSLKERVHFVGQPLQTFFFAGCVFLATSLGCFVGMLWMNSGYQTMLFLSIGVGCMVGSGLSSKVFSDRLLLDE